MWKTFLAEENIYVIKLIEVDDKYNFYITNLSKIWCCELSKVAISQKFQECNPLIDVKTDAAMVQVLNLFKNIDKFQVDVIILESSLKFTIISNLSDSESKVKIKFEMELESLENQSFTEIFTIPLIQTVILLEKQQNTLKKLLIKKDRELQEYHMEKGVISRSDLITEKFNPESIISSSSNLMLNVFNDVEFQIIKKYGDVQEKVAEVEVEMWNKVKKKRKIFSKDTTARNKNKKIVYKSENV